MLTSAYGVLEELCAEIGYTATDALVNWFGGGNLWVPQEATPDHPIAKVIDMAAFNRLIRYVDRRATNRAVDRAMWLPLGYQREIDRRDRMIAALLARGASVDEVASIAQMSKRHVYDVRRRVEDMGVLPTILRMGGIARGFPQETATPDAPLESVQEKPPKNARGKPPRIPTP